MATTGTNIINEVRAETGELSPDKITDALILSWIDDDTLGVFLQFVDILQDRYQSSINTATLTWLTNEKWKDATIATALFKVVAVVDTPADATTMPTPLIPLTLAQVWGFNGNPNYASRTGWYQIDETTIKITLGSSATGDTVYTVYGVKKPTLLGGVAGSNINLPDEFIPLIKLKVKIRAFDLLGRLDKVQSKTTELAERIQGIEQSARIVNTQATEGRALGIR